jgi:hypothetical protein
VSIPESLRIEDTFFHAIIFAMQRGKPQPIILLEQGRFAKGAENGKKMGAKI